MVPVERRRAGWLSWAGLTVFACAVGLPSSQPAAGAIRVVAEDRCEGAVCHLLKVTCEGLPAREVRVREFGVEEARGAVVFTTGVYGIRRYDENATKRRTVEVLREAGFQVFQLEWGGGRWGWGADAEGAGFKRPLCGYAEVVRWIASERAKQPRVMCAQGNSGGALQIAFGLAVYGLEDLLDMVVLSGGPPVSRVDRFCFGTQKESGAKESGRRFVDYLMGWRGNGDNCLTQLATPEIVSVAKATSLVSETEPRDFDYPKTKVNVVVSERDRSRLEGRVYYDEVTSAKDWYAMPGSTHAIDGVEEGARKIRELMLDECRER